jgi:cellulose synthase/poly-beta-1,6-N-acetylglucosamine synthase-like glycosyltransferase
MIVGIIAAALATVAALPLVILTVETVAGLAGQRQHRVRAAMPRTTVLVPAHDEAGGIAAVIVAIKAHCSDILVVADNCTDATAANARAAGARVVERTDLAKRGKGYALAFGREALAADAPEVVIIMDADCTPQGDALPALARIAAHTGRVVQGRYELETRADDPPMTRISNFAFAVKNVIRQRGLMRIAGTCVLTGTGMAFPWDSFRDAPLATADSVEDLAIGLALVRLGQSPTYADEARVSSQPASGKAALTQRTRWEHGFVATASKVAPPMIGRGIAGLDWRLIWLGLHLLVPPLALAFAVALLALAIISGLGWFSSFMPALALTVVILMATVAILGGWLVVGRTILPFAVLLRVPLYMLWKLPIYLKLARGADRRWIRTERD